MGSPQILSSYWNGTDLKAYVNGSQSGSASANVTGLPFRDDFQIGYDNNHNSDFLQGDIAEIIVYNSIITDTQRQQVEAYLQAKYGISSGYGTVSRDTSTTYGGSVGSAKVVVGSNTTDYIQSVNVGNTNSYNLSAYAYTDGSAVTASDAELFYNGSTVSTNYTAVGGGWYKLSGTVVGAASSRDYGVRVKSARTVYLDNLSLRDAGTVTGTLTSSIFDSGFTNGANWGTLSYNAVTPTGTAVQVKVRTGDQADLSDADSFSSCSSISNGSSASGNTCVRSGDRYAQYQVVLSTTDTSASSSTFDNFSLDFSDATPPATPTPSPTPTPTKQATTSQPVSNTSTESTYISQSNPADSPAQPTAESETEAAQKPQSSTPKGYDVNIVVKNGGKPVAGATVELHSTPRTAMTDRDGVARFADVEGGEHDLKITYNGHTSQQKITLSGDSKQVVINVSADLGSSRTTTYSWAWWAIVPLLVVFIWWILAKRHKQQNNPLNI